MSGLSLQTTPSHMLGQLDKVLREASTLDGVLEFRHEHFWTLSFGTLVSINLGLFFIIYYILHQSLVIVNSEDPDQT